MKKSKITSHILDVELGRPASNVEITLEKIEGKNIHFVATGITDSDGRVMDWLPDNLTAGNYRISFGVKKYFETQNRKCFYPQVAIDFMIENISEHFHVPLLLTAHGYTTYRGS